jgi:hypothetical protein
VPRQNATIAEASSRIRPGGRSRGALIGHGHSGEHFLSAADTESFAAALVSVLRGEAGELGPNGRSLAEQFLSVEALARELGA